MQYSVGNNIKKTADQVKSICKTAEKLKIDIVFGGLGIELLPDMSDVIKKTFIKYRELDQLV